MSDEEIEKAIEKEGLGMLDVSDMEFTKQSVEQILNKIKKYETMSHTDKKGKSSSGVHTPSKITNKNTKYVSYKNAKVGSKEYKDYTIYDFGPARAIITI